MSFQRAAVLLHGFAAAIMAYGYNSLGSLATDTWVKSQKGGHFQYLTIHSLSVAWLTMVISLAVDFFPSSVVMKNVKRVLLMTALPLAVVTSLIYWTLILLSPSLILQKDPNSEPSSSTDALMRVPLPIDLALHAVPGLALCADFMLLESKFSKNETRYGALLVIFPVAVWYVSWVEYCASFNGTFPYPFLTVNPFEIRVGIYIAVMTFALVSFWTLNALHPDKRSR